MAVFYRPLAPGTRFGFSHTIPAFVVDDLADLHGPTNGTATLPIHIDWTPSPTYDQSDPERLQTMYETVLREAGSEDEVAEWIDRDLLLGHWGNLGLPSFVFDAWEATHPELRQPENDGGQEHPD